MIFSASTRVVSLLLLSSVASAVNLECAKVQVDKKKFDLSKLGGPHSILVQDTEALPSKSNTTWTIDLCQAIKKPSNVPNADSCPNYTRGKFFIVPLEADVISQNGLRSSSYVTFLLISC